MSLENRLQSLEASGLLRLVAVRPELEYLFRHALLQEATYHTLVKQDRKRLHLAVGEILERFYPERAADLAPVLARHFAEAGDEPRALQYYTQAGAHAAQRYANAEAVMHYARALEFASANPGYPAPQLADLYTRLGRSLELNGHYVGALANYEAMHAHALRRADRSLELAALMHLAQMRSTPNPGFDAGVGTMLCEQALSLARALDDRHAEAKIRWNQVNLFMFMGRMAESTQAGEEGMRLARELGLHEQLAYLLNDIWRAYIASGHWERALQSVQEAGSLWRELQNLPMLTDSLINASESYFFGGRYDEALRAAEEGLQLSRSIHNIWGLSYSQFAVGYIHWDRGDPARAIEVMELCVRQSIEAGFTTPQIHTRAELAWVYGSLGDVQHGIELAELAEQCAVTQLPVFRAQALATLARLHLLHGAAAEAETALRAASADFATLLPLVKPAVFLATLAVALAQRDYPRALQVSDEFIDYLTRLNFRYVRADAYYLKGCALMETNRLDESRATLTEARTAAESLGAPRILWQILMALSTIALRSGQPDHAADLRRQARDLLLSIASHTPAHLRTSFLSLPAVQAALAS